MVTKSPRDGMYISKKVHTDAMPSPHLLGEPGLLTIIDVHNFNQQVLQVVISLLGLNHRISSRSRIHRSPTENSAPDFSTI